MTLAELLRELSTRSLHIRVQGSSPSLRGDLDKVDDLLRQALAEHREHLLRLHRPLDRAAPAWRKALDSADPLTREAWALLAAGGEQAGLHPAAAEYLAWETACP